MQMLRYHFWIGKLLFIFACKYIYKIVKWFTGEPSFEVDTKLASVLKPCQQDGIRAIFNATIESVTAVKEGQERRMMGKVLCQLRAYYKGHLCYKGFKLVTQMLRYHFWIGKLLFSVLKPHQQDGIRAMFNATIESVTAVKEVGQEGGGMILAHYLGSNKSLHSWNNYGQWAGVNVSWSLIAHK